MQRSFPRDLSSLEPLFEFAGDFARSNRLADADAFAMNLAVEELFTNIVKYGGGDDTVSVGLEVRGDSLVIEIEHARARRFDPTMAPGVDKTRPLDERQPGGLGLELVRSVMDELSYENRDDTAHVTVTKRLTPRGGA